MGVLNITPDSFYDGGRFVEEEKVLMQTKRMLNEGASLSMLEEQVLDLAQSRYRQKKKSSE